jgi:hypothetical protein
VTCPQYLCHSQTQDGAYRGAGWVVCSAATQVHQGVVLKKQIGPLVGGVPDLEYELSIPGSEEKIPVEFAGQLLSTRVQIIVLRGDFFSVLGRQWWKRHVFFQEMG